MKKSPLSMPGGSRNQDNYGWRSCVDTRRTNSGFDTYKRGSFSYNWRESNRGDDDFIPLNNSTPDQMRPSGNRYGSGVGRHHRNSGSSLFNHNRGNYFANTKPHFNNSYSPYKHTGMQFHGQNKSMQKNDHRQVDISRYVDINSVLEDPWAELIHKLCGPKTPSKMDVSNGCSSIPDFKENRESVPLIYTHFQNTQNNPEFKSQPIDVDLEVSNNTPKYNAEDSSCTEQEDIKLDMILNNESLCNVSNDNYQATNKDNKKNIQQFMKVTHINHI